MSSIFHHASTQTHAQTASPQPLSMSGQLSAISLDSSLLWGPSQASRDWTESNMKRGHRKDCKIRLLIVGLCTALLIGAMTVRRIMSISVFLGHRESLDFELEAETGLTPPSPPV